MRITFTRKLLADIKTAARREGLTIDAWILAAIRLALARGATR